MSTSSWLTDITEKIFLVCTQMYADSVQSITTNKTFQECVTHALGYIYFGNTTQDTTSS